MGKFQELILDIGDLWGQYGALYLRGIRSTLVLALVATAIGCVIGFACGALNTIPYTQNDSLLKRFMLKTIRVVIRIYVELFRGTPMLLQAVFIFYGLPYVTNNMYRFNSIWLASILIVS
ncbi:MAG: amino acid ABC transporter permease, partial [Clostridiales bacterium]|nr:amino acid ABC transporter permease [Clostridiales bacterium]